MKKKIFCVGYAIGYTRWIDGGELTSDINEADIIFFTGGEDINPQIYGCVAHPDTYFSRRRDAFELEMYAKVREDQLCVGTCRGLQLGCALNGGILVQDVTAHWGGQHEIRLVPDVEDLAPFFEIVSLHHQMIYPYDLPKENYDLLYVSSNNRSMHYEGDKITEDRIAKLKSYGEPEVVLFHTPGKPKFLGFQGHPEMMPSNSMAVATFNKIINNIL